MDDMSLTEAFGKSSAKTARLVLLNKILSDAVKINTYEDLVSYVEGLRDRETNEQD